MALGKRLSGQPFALVLTSPLSRAADTARLAGFGDVMVVDEDLREWDYGSFEGRKTDEIREQYPDWTIWRGPWPGGESIDEVAARADRILKRVRTVDGDVLIFSTATCCGSWPPAGSTGNPGGGMFALSTATISRLGWEREAPVIERWNEACGA